jgi:hypothetical protein
MTADEFNHLFDAAVTAHMPDFEPDASRAAHGRMEAANRSAPASGFQSANTTVRGQHRAGRPDQFRPAASRRREPHIRHSQVSIVIPTTVQHTGGAQRAKNRRNNHVSGTSYQVV